MNKTTINWGIIGCGDVTEMKSGPAFNKVNNSKLVAVMRRDASKAADYAMRHNVPKWYDDAGKVINDEEVNAIYIATPPSSHAEYTLAAVKAGKPVYVEKPMTLDKGTALKMTAAANVAGVKLVVAHYRRQMPYFKKIKELLDAGSVGKPLMAKLEYYKRPLTREELAVTKNAWRVDPAIAGGGLFHDLAPHQLDLLYYFLGEITTAHGVATNQSGLYKADDVVAGNILFKSGAVFTGSWCFSVPVAEERDVCEIIGTKGKIVFSFFEMKTFKLITGNKTTDFTIDTPVHVQQPMIEKVVDYFLGKTGNPCSGEDGALVMNLVDTLSVNRKITLPR
ncbi:MAG: Gfo/Idh/MocA family oxidoreductase [Ferruginibacter sp.]